MAKSVPVIIFCSKCDHAKCVISGCIQIFSIIRRTSHPSLLPPQAGERGERGISSSSEITGRRILADIYNILRLFILIFLIDPSLAIGNYHTSIHSLSPASSDSLPNSILDSASLVSLFSLAYSQGSQSALKNSKLESVSLLIRFFLKLKQLGFKAIVFQKIAKVPPSVETNACLGGIYASLQQAFALRKTTLSTEKNSRLILLGRIGSFKTSNSFLALEGQYNFMLLEFFFIANRN